MKHKDIFSIVLYFSNEKMDVASILQSFIAKTKQYFENFEIIILDNSDYGEPIKSTISHFENCKISYIKLHKGETEDKSFFVGISQSIGDFVIELPAHLVQDHLETIYENIDLTYDVIFYRNKKSSFFKKNLYNIFNQFIQTKIDLQSSRFHMISRTVVNKFLNLNENAINRKVIYSLLGNRRKYIALSLHIKSNYNLENIFETILFYTPFGVKITQALILSFFSITVSISAYTLIIYFLGYPIEGWTSIVLFLGFIGLCLFVILYIIVKYLYYIFLVSTHQLQDSVDSIEIYDN